MARAGERKRIHLFLLTEQNAFQLEQAKAAEGVARELGLDLEIRFADGNAMVQINQLFESIHAKAGPAPDAILVEPVAGDVMPRVAKNAIRAGIAWGAVNCASPYLPDLHREFPAVPAFDVRVDNVEVGRMQGRQLRKLLSRSAEPAVLYVQGPPAAATAQQRSEGMAQELSGHELALHRIDADWTEPHAESVVKDWLRLHKAGEIDVVVGQNDEMAEGARKALTRHAAAASETTRYIGCDGLSSYGQRLVTSGHLAATIVTGLPSQKGVELLARFLASGEMPPQTVTLDPESFPPLDELAAP